MNRLITHLTLYRVLTGLFIAGLFISGQPALAVVFKDLYAAEVLAASQSRSDLKKGAKEGLLQVLVRVSGDPDVGRKAVVQQALKKASTFYSQYGYSTTDRQIVVNGKEKAAKLLTLHFDPKAINVLIRKDAGLKIWGSNRPAILVWIAIDEGRGKRLLTSEEDGEIAVSLAAHAKRRGLPLIFPVMDLEDTANVSVPEVWGGFLDNIEKASKRYDPDSILTARLSRRRDGKWSGNWSYRPKDRWFNLARQNKKTDEITGEVIDRMANEQASLFGLGASEAIIWLKIQAVDSVRDYARLSQYVESLAPVLDASIDEVTGKNAIYRLRIAGVKEQLMEVIDLDRKMRLVKTSEGISRESAILYRWMN